MADSEVYGGRQENLPAWQQVHQAIGYLQGRPEHSTVIVKGALQAAAAALNMPAAPAVSMSIVVDTSKYELDQLDRLFAAIRTLREVGDGR